MLPLKRRRPIRWLALALAAIAFACVPNRIRHERPDEYLSQVHAEGHESLPADLAIIEFDDFGQFWKRDQLEDTLELIRTRNAEAERGVLVVVYAHGWMNDSNPSRKKGALETFRVSMADLAVELEAAGSPAPDRVVGVYIGWRGAVTRVPLLSQMSFWSRQDAAERMASYNMRETFFRLVKATKVRPESKVMLSGHSMGGMIVAKTLGPSLTTMLLASGEEGMPAFADMVVLMNPALDALSSYHLIEYLKRTETRVELRQADGTVRPAAGPVIAAITSEVDWVTKTAYPAGQVLGLSSAGVRHDEQPGQPSQWKLATRALGHVKELISHRAWVEDGEVRFERVPDSFNTTPYWVVQVSSDISSGHGDIHGPEFRELVRQLTLLNALYDAESLTWLRNGRPGAMEGPSLFGP